MKKLRIAIVLLLCSALFGCDALHLPFATGHAATTGPVRSVAASPAARSVGADSSARADAPDATAPGRQQVLDAFREIAFGSEYGGGAGQIRKWSVPVKALIHGNPTEQDRATVEMVFDELNAVAGFPGISLTGSGQNMDIWFIPLGDMPDVLPGYVEGNWGFFTAQYDSFGITSVTVAIATDVTGQTERNHLIQEEIIQSTGLMQDSYRNEDSIFYGDWTTIQHPSQLDWELIGILYMPQLAHGMAEEEAMDLIDKLYKPSWDE